jgi:2-polyprenyl-3-methyl-5-hydroxy-6-metoxy-1,4-benzoquinol methylase
MKPEKEHQIQSTKDSEYTAFLTKRQGAWWKHIFDVQAPYRWNLQRLRLGLTLDIGCGIGRNLKNLKGYGVGIDHNLQSIEIARQHAFIAFTPEEFYASKFNTRQRFDSILLAHVAEHMKQLEVVELLAKYLPLLKDNGRVIVITPQEAGFRSDASHVEFMDFAKLRFIGEQLDLSVVQEYSFPFPRFVGSFFLYNEFVSVWRKISNLKKRSA